MQFAGKIMDIITDIAGNPQLITLRLPSTHDQWDKWQRNPYSHVIILKHFDKSQMNVFIANQITTFKCI